MSRPFRYTFILGLVALATGLAAIGGWRYARASAPVNGPIILISVDALRADRLPIYGYQRVRTPAIDALAADGVVFERAYSHVPQTLPAHAALLTGRLPFETGVRDNAGFIVAPGERLVSEMLRDRDYSTAAIVSSFLLRRETGIAQGFGFFDDEVSAAPESIGVGLWRPGEESVEVAEQWLERVGTSRVFLFLHLFEPHTARLALEGVADGTAYDLEVVRADEILGRLIRYLKSHQLYDSSTIVLVSDHGEGLGEHGEQQHGLLVYDEALRVPLIIKQSAGEGAGRRISIPVQHLDLVPTLLDLAKAPGPDNLRGASLKPLLEGSGTLPRRFIYSESLYGRYQLRWSALTTVTDGKYRYISGAQEELYDLEADPSAQRNLASDDPSIPAWRLNLERFARKETPQPPAVVAPWVRERLEALGHLAASVWSGEEPPPNANQDDHTALLAVRREAMELTTGRRWLEAISLLRSALTARPEALELWMQLGRTYARSGRDELALAAYRRVIALRPDNEAARLASAEALLKLRRIDEAKQSAAIVADSSQEPHNLGAANLLLAEIAVARGDAVKARQHTLAAGRSDASLPVTEYVEARLLHTAGNWLEALPLYEKAIADLGEARRGTIPELHFHYAEALTELKRDEDAERQYLTELAMTPHHIRARAALALLYQRTGRTVEANEAMSAITAISPTAEAFRVTARLWERFGEASRAAASRAEARRLSTQ